MLAVAAALIGYASVRVSLAQAVMKVDPATAHKLAPGNGEIAARLSWRLWSAPQSTSDDRTRATRLARQALQGDPTGVAAVAVLGADAKSRGDGPRAKQLYRYSEKLSRRNLPTQLWAIEHATINGDVAAALRHFDIAMRTSPSAASALFPALTTAMAEPPIRTEMARTLLRGSDWKDAFITYVSLNNPDPRQTAALFRDLRRGNQKVSAQIQANLVNALISKQFVADAWQAYVQYNPSTDRRVLRSPGFGKTPDAPTLFDWTMTNDGVISSAIQEGHFEYSVPATVGGVVLQQLQRLDPGSYRLQGRSVEIAPQAVGLIYWTLTCEGGAELGRIAVPGSNLNGGVFSGSFTVPASCPAQRLALVAKPSDALSGSFGKIDWVRLSPALPSRGQP